MGQIFFACAYDIDTKECSVECADKFHASCYSYSGAVHSIHYLLRQRAFRVMWAGGYIMDHDNLECITRFEDLLGISTCIHYIDFGEDNSNSEDKSYYDKVQLIKRNTKHWNRITVYDEAMKYFDWKKNHSVKYSGYLINHTQKLAINLADYYESSRYQNEDGINIVVDPIPVLTETGGGIQMLFFDGSTSEKTFELAETWCGDLLQIVDTLPESYTVIQCYFSEVQGMVQYCYRKFGADEEGYVLRGNDGRLFLATAYNLYGERGREYYMKAEIHKDEGIVKFIPIVKEQDA